MPTTPLDTVSYRYLQEYVYRESGIVLDDDKAYLMEARLMPIVEEMRLGTLNDLCALLRATDQVTLRQSVLEAMTTNETYFFRDMPQYETLKLTVIPALMQERQASRTLRFWSAASSSGQEAYSLAMMLLDMRITGWNIDILGTDLSTRMLQRASDAKYLQIEVNRGLPITSLVKYFRQAGSVWQLREEVRRMVRFQRVDLRQPPPGLGPFDVVFCRNVLIYFDIAAKRKILAHIAGAVRPGGYLLLGSSETTLNVDNTFEPQTIGKALLYRLPSR